MSIFEISLLTAGATSLAHAITFVFVPDRSLFRRIARFNLTNLAFTSWALGKRPVWTITEVILLASGVWVMTLAWIALLHVLSYLREQDLESAAIKKAEAALENGATREF